MLTELRPERADACLSDLIFDSWRAGELSAAERDAAEAHLTACPRCRARREELDLAAATFLAQHPILASDSRGRSATSSLKGAKRAPFHQLFGWAGVGVAAVLGVLLYVRAGSPPATPQAVEHGTRLKGSDRIGFFVRRGERVFEGVDGQRVQPGDQLRFVASASTPRHVAILSRDGAGVASVYYPTGSARSRSLAPAQSGPLESAVELDETLGRERLFGIFCESSFELEPLREQLERLGKLVAPAGCKVDVLELVKDRPE